MSGARFEVRGLYAMVDVPATVEGGAATALAGALVDGGARIVQLRMKGADAAAQLAIARTLAPWCRARGVTFIVNDRVDVALAAGADGVHLGQDDLPLAAVRSLAPRGFVIGVSTHDEAQARAAAAARRLHRLRPVLHDVLESESGSGRRRAAPRARLRRLAHPRRRHRRHYPRHRRRRGRRRRRRRRDHPRRQRRARRHRRRPPRHRRLRGFLINREISEIREGSTGRSIDQKDQTILFRI